MMHRMLRYPSGWEWHMLHRTRPEASGLSRRARHAAAESPASAVAASSLGAARDETLRELMQAQPELAGWLEESLNRRHNHIAVTELAGGEPLLCGTLLYQASEDRKDIVPLHFWLTSRRLVTLCEDLRLSIRLQLDPWEEKLGRCQTAPEAFFVMTGHILETLHGGLDAFEKQLGELETQMSKGNRTGLMDVIFERRYDLLHWNHLFIPIREIHGAAKEAFMQELTEREEFQRSAFKLERIAELLNHYALQIDTLLAMDEAVANLRGNDIMKTLTVFTALFTPAAVIGSMWGMNFDRLPWAQQPWGFGVIALIISVMTGSIYWWLWRKGWTGDLLRRQPKPVLAAAALKEQLPPPFNEDRPLPSRSEPISAALPAASAKASAAELDGSKPPLPKRSRRRKG
jgi:magnesium transporter